jgi:hypothetical protein
MSVEDNVTLWAKRADGRYPTTLLLERIFREGGYSARLDRSRRTTSHIAVATSLAERALTAQVLTDHGWKVDEDYLPSPEEITEPAWLQSRPLRRITTLSGPLIDECFGEERKWIRWRNPT